MKNLLIFVLFFLALSGAFAQSIVNVNSVQSLTNKSFYNVGTLGIGTLNPQANLHVKGTFLIEPAAAVNAEYQLFDTSGKWFDFKVPTMAVNTVWIMPATPSTGFVLGTLSAATNITLSYVSAGAGTGPVIRLGSYRTIYIDAGAFTPNSTAGATAKSQETTSNKVNSDYFEFAEAATSGITCKFPMPKDWNLGTIKYKVFWSSTNAQSTRTCVWEGSAVAVSHDDPTDAAFGTIQTVQQDVTAADDLMLTSASSALTIGGTPAQEDLIWFRVRRLPADANDDLEGMAKFLGIWIQYQEGTTEATTW
jgi:hypothetical protein